MMNYTYGGHRLKMLSVPFDTVFVLKALRARTAKKSSLTTTRLFFSLLYLFFLSFTRDRAKFVTVLFAFGR